jgi:hypothetical protein
MGKAKALFFYREDIAGLWVFMKVDGEEIIIGGPFKDAHKTTVVKRYLARANRQHMGQQSDIAS